MEIFCISMAFLELFDYRFLPLYTIINVWLYLMKENVTPPPPHPINRPLPPFISKAGMRSLTSFILVSIFWAWVWFVERVEFFHKLYNKTFFHILSLFVEWVEHVFVVHLSMVFMLLKGFEWKKKADNLEVELQQCYKARSQLSEKLAMEFQQCYKAQSQLSESRASKALLQEKENTIADMQKELTKLRLLDVSSVLEQSLIFT